LSQKNRTLRNISIPTPSPNVTQGGIRNEKLKRGSTTEKGYKTKKEVKVTESIKNPGSLKNRRDLPKSCKELLEGTSLDKKEEDV